MTSMLISTTTLHKKKTLHVVKQKMYYYSNCNDFFIYALPDITYSNRVLTRYGPSPVGNDIHNLSNFLIKSGMEYNAWFKQPNGKYTEIIVYNISKIITPPHYEFISYGTNDLNSHNNRIQIGVDFRIAPYIDTSDLPKLDGTFNVSDHTNSLFLNDFNDTDDGLSNVYDKKYLFNSLQNHGNAAYPITKPESISQYIDTLTNLVHASAAQFTN